MILARPWVGPGLWSGHGTLLRGPEWGTDQWADHHPPGGSRDLLPFKRSGKI